MEGSGTGLTEVLSLHLPPEIEKNYGEPKVRYLKLRSSEYAISIPRSFLSHITTITTKDYKTKNTEVMSQAKSSPLQAWTGPYGSRWLKLIEFQGNQHMKVVRLSALHTGLLYSQDTP
jgi:hypothetical protein